jgi:multidrug efflux pump subunit AcrB
MRRGGKRPDDTLGKHPDRAGFWLNPKTGVSYPVSIQTPQYRIDTLGSLKNLPLSAAQSTQLLGGLAAIVPEPVNVLVSHYNIRPTVNIYATTQGRDLGTVAADIRKLIEEAKQELLSASVMRSC